MSEAKGLRATEDAVSFAQFAQKPCDIGIRSDATSRPLFLLAPPRSHSGLACAMLGQHPQMYGLPETHLFSAPTMAKWWEKCSTSTYHMEDGLLRAVAQLYFGEQNDGAIKAALGWLKRRAHFTTGFLFEQLAERVSPLILVEKSPTLISRPIALQRAFAMFPRARFIHIVQHPRSYGESLMKGIQEAAKHGPVPYWMLHLASFPGRGAREDGTAHDSPGLDPQRAWYVLNMCAYEFLKSLPEDQKMAIRGEDLLACSEQTLRRITGWMGLRMDDEVIERMKHPERSPYARFGPPSARYGNESFFLHGPALGPKQPEVHTLDGPLSWKPTAQDLLPEVKELARKFGYQ
jgi:Sulfotransferase family